MSHDPIDYQRLTHAALRDVVRRTLEIVAEGGLPPGHFFYITFVTQAPGVVLAPELVARYPDEMTIILQHQFRELVVEADSFSVGLSFSSLPQIVTVPFAAVVSFVDPPAEFGLRFPPPPGFETEEPDAARENDEGEDIPAPAAEPAPAEDTVSATAKVVSLDDFRKK